MERDQALNIMSKDAWYSAQCSNSDTWRTDVYFYGSKDWDRAEIVILFSELADGRFRVEQVATFDEPNVWHTAYRDCVDRGVFE
jgi:hypothetical protein